MNYSQVPKFPEFVNNVQEPLLKSSFKATHPSQEVYSASKTFVIDSRQRNCKKYETPSFYKIDIPDVIKNITSIELKGITLPKSSYNIHTGNNLIDFAIGDFVSSYRVTDGGSGYTVAPAVVISAPIAGVTATATSVINARGEVTNIVVGVAGSGYSPSKPPFVFIAPPPSSGHSRQATASAIVGDHYTATLRRGEYIVGGNPVPPATLPSNLLLEIQNAMNYVVNGGAYSSTSTSPFAVRLVSQYPELGATAGTPEASDTNATRFNRIQFTNVNNDYWEFLFCSGPNKINSAYGVLGFNMTDIDDIYTTAAVDVGAGNLIPAGTTIRATYDYNLNQDPDYVILEIKAGDESFDRIESFGGGLNYKFAVLLFDANNPDVLHDLTAGTGGTVTTVGSVAYLEGPLGKGTFWREPGRMKALKGADFGIKKKVFAPALGKLSSLSVSFTKYGLKPGGVPEFYPFDGREHALIFEVSATDQASKQKE